MQPWKFSDTTALCGRLGATPTMICTEVNTYTRIIGPAGQSSGKGVRPPVERQKVEGSLMSAN